MLTQQNQHAIARMDNSSNEFVWSKEVPSASDEHSAYHDDRTAEGDAGREAMLIDERSCNRSASQPGEADHKGGLTNVRPDLCQVSYGRRD
jgi:hypothetical protein